MKIQKLICRLDGTQELRETEAPDDWGNVDLPPENVAETQSATVEKSK